MPDRGGHDWPPPQEISPKNLPSRSDGFPDFLYTPVEIGEKFPLFLGFVLNSVTAKKTSQNPP
jgi:hypothetical protein